MKPMLLACLLSVALATASATLVPYEVTTKFPSLGEVPEKGKSDSLQTGKDSYEYLWRSPAAGTEDALPGDEYPYPAATLQTGKDSYEYLWRSPAEGTKGPIAGLVSTYRHPEKAPWDEFADMLGDEDVDGDIYSAVAPGQGLGLPIVPVPSKLSDDSIAAAAKSRGRRLLKAQDPRGNDYGPGEGLEGLFGPPNAKPTPPPAVPCLSLLYDPSQAPACGGPRRPPSGVVPIIPDFGDWDFGAAGTKGPIDGLISTYRHPESAPWDDWAG